MSNDRNNDEKKTLGKVRLKNVRLSFSKNLFVAGTFKDGDGEPKFSSSFILYRDDPDGKRNIVLCNDAVDDLTRDYEDRTGKRFPAIEDLDSKSLAYFSGENSRGEAKYEGWENSMIVSALNERRPLVIDRDKSPLVAEDGKPYAGCIVNAVVRFWLQDNKWGKALRCSLVSVQFVKDGDSFGPEQASADDYDNLDEDEGQSSRSSSRGRDEGRDRGRESRGRDEGRDRGRDREESRGRDRDDRGRDRDDRGRGDRDDRGRDREESRGRDRDDRRDDRRSRESDRDRDRDREEGRGRDRDRDDGRDMI